MKLLNNITDVQSIAISGHVKPDGDCIGSCLGLYQYIKENYPELEVDVYLEDVPPEFHYLAGAEEVKKNQDGLKVYDLFIALDCGDMDRLGFAGGYFARAKKSVCVDHHISNTAFAMENIVVPQAAATCEILFDEMEPDKISLETACALYTGLIHDTGVFKHSNTTEHTMTVAGKLIGLGVPFTKIINESFYQKTYLQNQILGRALLESIRFMDGKCIATVLRRKELDFYGVNNNDLGGIIDQLIITEGVECAIFLHETDPQVFKVSMRSKEYLDVSTIAVRFGGGGHVRAAGCTITGSEHDVINNISLEMERQMKQLEARNVSEEEL